MQSKLLVATLAFISVLIIIGTYPKRAYSVQDSAAAQRGAFQQWEEPSTKLQCQSKAFQQWEHFNSGRSQTRSYEATMLPSLGGFTNQLISLRILQGVLWAINHSLVVPHLGGSHIRWRGHPNFTRMESYVDAEALRNCSIGGQLASADDAVCKSDRVHFVCVADPWYTCRSLAARFNCSGHVSLSCNWTAAHLWLSAQLPRDLRNFMQMHQRLVAWTQLSTVEASSGGKPQLVRRQLVAATQHVRNALVVFSDPFFSGALKAIGNSSSLGASCDPLVNPAARIVHAARAALGALCSGEPFLSVHWRRGDFFDHHMTRLERMAYLIGTRAELIGVTCVLLLSDSSVSDQERLRTLTEKLVPGIKIHTEASLKAEKGAEIDTADVDAHALKGKLVAAQAAVFIGTEGSTFTGQVVELRKFHGWSSEHDLIVKAGVVSREGGTVLARRSRVQTQHRSTDRALFKPGHLDMKLRTT